jgi:YidC/Oxa1 family membrane protein insertase
LAEFSNPNQQGSQDNRSLVAMMVLMMVALFGYQYYRLKINPEPASPPAASGSASTVPSQSAPTAAQATAVSQPAAPAARPATPTVPVVQATAETNTIIENELYRITFSNRGGQVTSWVLKQLKNSDGNPLDLVSPEASRAFGDPLSLYTADLSIATALNQALFVPSRLLTPVKLDTNGGYYASLGKLTFTYSDGNLQATKTFSFDETYVLHAEVAVTRNGSPIPALISWPGGFGDQDETSNGTAYSNAQFDSDSNGTQQHLAAKKINNGETLSGPFDFAGVSDPFFAAVFLPDSPATTNVVTLRNQLDVGRTLKRTGLSAGSTKPLEMPILGAAAGSTSGPTETRIFVGPKLIDVLKGVHAADPKVTLEPVLEFGFWGLIGKPLFLALHFIHDHMLSGWSGSWGWSIVLLTIFINILTLPFKVKTMQSALKMQRIQPQMDAIKERYKKYKVTDPKRNEMNAEIMQLQKDNGVNMFGGCIPSLITFPLLIAFFGMIPKVVELRQAHWYWLPNLQAQDPYHILPIVMIGSMFLMQYYTPSPGVDPQQQKMMAFMMPAFSGYMTWTYPSALGLYWAVGNLISIAQQAVMNRTSLGREMREIAAKRARRKAGTIQGRK